MAIKKQAESATAVTEAPALAAGSDVVVSAEAALGNWGAVTELETTDLLVPKIYHQQAMSKFVSEGKARPGDFCDSLTGELLVERGLPLEVIIFGVFKTLIVQKFEPMKRKFKLLEIITVTPENSQQIAALPFEEEKTSNGITDRYKNSLFYNFYCLIPSKLNKLPFVLSMGSTKTKAAKKLNNMIYDLSRMEPPLPSAAVVFELRSTEEKNDSGQWAGLEVSQGRKVTAKELMTAFAWFGKSKTQNFVVVEEEATEEASANIPRGQHRDDDDPGHPNV